MPQFDNILKRIDELFVNAPSVDNPKESPFSFEFELSEAHMARHDIVVLCGELQSGTIHAGDQISIPLRNGQFTVSQIGEIALWNGSCRSITAWGGGRCIGLALAIWNQDSTLGIEEISVPSQICGTPNAQ